MSLIPGKWLINHDTNPLFPAIKLYTIFEGFLGPNWYKNANQTDSIWLTLALKCLWHPRAWDHLPNKDASGKSKAYPVRLKSGSSKRKLWSNPGILGVHPLKGTQLEQNYGRLHQLYGCLKGYYVYLFLGKHDMPWPTFFGNGSNRITLAILIQVLKFF